MKTVLFAAGIVLLAAVNVPFYLYLGRRFFGDWSGFWEALRFLAMPEIFSALKGEYHDDVWEEFKLGVFVVICALSFLVPFSLLYLWFKDAGA